MSASTSLCELAVLFLLGSTGKPQDLILLFKEGNRKIKKSLRLYIQPFSFFSHVKNGIVNFGRLVGGWRSYLGFMQQCKCFFISSVTLKVSCIIWSYKGLSSSNQPVTWGILEHASVFKKGKCAYQAMCGISGHQLAFSATRFVTFCSTYSQCMSLAMLMPQSSFLKYKNKDLSDIPSSSTFATFSTEYQKCQKWKFRRKFKQLNNSQCLQPTRACFVKSL